MNYLLKKGGGKIRLIYCLIIFSCYENVRFEVTRAGGTRDRREAVRDGHIITAQISQSHPEFYRSSGSADSNEGSGFHWESSGGCSMM
jgi:hypothetical protein